ncbi:hypothetical protein [Mangrovibrevibacter kandeliae]|uniref:hypothetical protein n=1 Tax=Mangrovibrevibacter kandeliae TaxID=2968473 RepID=UPI0029FEF027|nr:hypothetical protein [Aurantimonas sp. MSK8Z-1]
MTTPSRLTIIGLGIALLWGSVMPATADMFWRGGPGESRRDRGGWDDHRAPDRGGRPYQRLRRLPSGDPLAITPFQIAPFRVADADCASAAEQAAAQTGGQVLSVSSRQQDGGTVCVVTVLVPGRDGGRPRKTTVTLRR